MWHVAQAFAQTVGLCLFPLAIGNQVAWLLKGQVYGCHAVVVWHVWQSRPNPPVECSGLVVL